jgi:hypothetical protein
VQGFSLFDYVGAAVCRSSMCACHHASKLLHRQYRGMRTKEGWLLYWQPDVPQLQCDARAR